MFHYPDEGWIEKTMEKWCIDVGALTENQIKQSVLVAKIISNM